MYAKRDEFSERIYLFLRMYANCLHLHFVAQQLRKIAFANNFQFKFQFNLKKATKKEKLPLTLNSSGRK